MSMDAFEYQIKKDIRNNPIVREVDEARVRELWRSTAVGGLFVALLLYSAWQHFELIRFGYRVEQLQQSRAAEEQANRHLRLQVQALQRPQRIEQIARTQLHMVQPGPNDAVVLERVRAADPPDRSIVALR
jgi:cell division protein FtsL